MDKLIVLVGPTGVGKTKLSVDIAKRFNGEIISGDAFQCYKEMSIGSAKIKEEEKEGIPHYLVDYLSYKEEYNVKQFQEQGRAYIKDIIARHKVPIICGGTGLYIKALLYDYLFEEESVDQAYLEVLQQKDNDTLYEMLKKIDAKATMTIHKNNRKRVIRALMMAHAGSKKSERLEKQTHTMLYDAYIVGLTMERELLYKRINERVFMMMEEGLEQEIKQLVHEESDFSLQSMRGIGYKEWVAYYRNEATLEETIALIQKNSRNFAKRQYTWFKNQMNVHWYDVSEESEKDKIMKDIEVFLGGQDER
ncbi:MAG: tRNA (adenosine(37)-N6)-dimethylallyltransferase MiaA [Erysipelotrichia bacterium]|nr:tRNA (adenosine(37)-N6)-dimethylallyltransferase MiaA [Erysipelotrichia bacterium]NCC54755.1 tRNA (adenosine(37)-N6)-dimethylallyltransferase MiaA [Erysipelotrichia bacterium]